MARGYCDKLVQRGVITAIELTSTLLFNPYSSRNMSLFSSQAI